MSYSINVSIDDVCPHPKSGPKLLEHTEYIRSFIPDIKFTLFIPTGYHRTYKHPAGPLVLTEYPEFVDKIKSLPRENYEIGFHGHLHGIPNERNDNDEFRDLRPEIAVPRLRYSIDIFRQIELMSYCVRSFRPPAWRAKGPTLAAIAKELTGSKDLAGNTRLCLAKELYALELYQLCSMDDSVRNSILWRTCDPPARPLTLPIFHSTQQADSPIEYIEVVYHACEWDGNFLTKELADDLIRFIKLYDLEPKFTGEIDV